MLLLCLSKTYKNVNHRFSVYDVFGAGSDRSVVVLNDIHIDIMDYIVPATCTDLEFRQMWAEFEWENKVSVNTTLSDLREYLAHLLKSTNMRCLTPEKVLYFKFNFFYKYVYIFFFHETLINFKNSEKNYSKILKKRKHLHCH